MAEGRAERLLARARAAAERRGVPVYEQTDGLGGYLLEEPESELERASRDAALLRGEELWTGGTDGWDTEPTELHAELDRRIEAILAAAEPTGVAEDILAELLEEEREHRRALERIQRRRELLARHHRLG